MSTNLQLADVLASQNQKEVTINANRSLLDQLLTQLIDIEMDDTDAVTVTATQLLDNVGLNIINGSPVPDAAGTVTIPADVKGPFIVKNTTVFQQSITIASQPGTVPIVYPGQTRYLMTDGTNVIPILEGEESIELFVSGVPTANAMLLQKVAARPFSILDELVSSQAFALTAPNGGAVAFDVQKNAVSVGTITFADTVQTATFVTAGTTQVDFAAGDRISIHSPANLQTMADVSFNLFAWRV